MLDPGRVHPLGSRRADGERGFTTVDLMVGALVAVVLIGGVLSMLVQQSHLRQTNAESALAASACMNRIEALRELHAEEIAALHGSGFDVPGPNLEPGALKCLPGDPDGLAGYLSVETDQSFGDDKLFLVQASVTWQGVTGRRTYSLKSLIGERK